MTVLLSLWIILFASIEWTSGELDCELVTNSGTEAGLSDYLLDNMNYSRNNKNSRNLMSILECHCTRDSESFEDRDIDRFIGNKIKNWKEALVLTVRDCMNLKLSLGDRRTDFSYAFRGGALILKNISKLDIKDFNAALSYNQGDSSKEDETFAGIYMINVTIDNSINPLQFEDRVEVVFNNVVTSPSVKDLEIAIKNKNESRNPIFRMENSDFRPSPGYHRQNINTPIYITINNDQVDKDGCYLHIGEAIFKNNHFASPATATIFMSRGDTFDFEGNDIEDLAQETVKLFNVQNVRIQNNFLGKAEGNNSFEILYELRSRSCDKDDFPENRIKQIQFRNNKMSELKYLMINPILDRALNEEMLESKFQMNGNVVLVPCNCQNIQTLPPNPTEAELIGMNILESSSCLSENGIFASRRSICSGILPKRAEELIDDTNAQVRSECNTFIVVAAVVSFIVGAVLSAIGMYFWLNNDKGTVSPRGP